jgi:hypothetical protein
MNTINFAARFEYLSALEVHWPQVLSSLHKSVRPVYLRCFKSRGESAAMQKLAGLSEALRRGASPELEEVALAVRTWAEEFGFRDAWLQDVALQTMHSWVHGGDKAKWTYFPDELDMPKLQVDCGHWFPLRGFLGHLEWPEFKRLADATYRRAVAAYRALVRKQWGEAWPKLSQHAVWTVLFQRGESPGWIQLRRRSTTGMVSLTNIMKCVHEFAAAAGLTLRAQKAGRPRKQPQVD